MDLTRYRPNSSATSRVRSLHNSRDVSSLLPLRPSRLGWCSLLLGLARALTAGCGGGNPSTDAGADAGPGVDGGRVDGSLPDGAIVLPDGHVIFPDSGVPDGAVVLPDGNVIFPDAGSDSGTQTDGGVDAGPIPDLGIPPGAGDIPVECLDTNGDVDLCRCLQTTDCSTVACPTGTVCEDDGCGGQRCVPAGHPCTDANDCPAGGTCEDTAAGRACRPPGAVCRDDRECPLGFSCEGATCVDRRVPCDNTPFSCPVGYVCDLVQQRTQAFCRRMDTPCATAAACAQPAACYDLDGDGDKECVTAELMCLPSTCAPDERICGPQNEEKGYSCGLLGSCAVQPCASPLVCIDFAGDGRPFCAPPGMCDAHADCAPGELCAIPHLEMSPRCVGPATGGTP